MVSLGKLAATVAHEINNPLAGISTYARLLRKGLAGNGKADRALAMMEDEAMRCGRIVRNLLAFAGVSLLEAVAACSLRPARVLGIEGDRGSLRPGARADFAVLDDSLRVRETWIAGRRVYSA